MPGRFLFTTFLSLLITTGFTQQITLLTSGNKTSLRGLSVVNDQVVWVSGSNGQVGRSTNGGITWQWITVPGFEKRDFRDIEAFDENTAIIIAIAEPAHILTTTDGGAHWNIVFTDSTKGMFLDAIDFYDRKHGIAVGDPVGGKFYLVRTANGGQTWQKVPGIIRPNAFEGEACFASSGTNIHYFKNKDFLLVSGGLRSRLHDDSGGRDLPIIQEKESAGANSLAVGGNSGRWVIVGGDFTKDKDTTRNCVLTFNGGQSWQWPATPPRGYRSCVIYLTKNKLLTCGTSGIDVSTDKGMHWQLISTDSYHVCAKAKKGKAVFLAGGNGRIAKYTNYSK